MKNNWPILGDGEVVGVEWRTGSTTVVFVAVQYERYWHAYIGAMRVSPGMNLEDADRAAIEEVADHGCKLNWREAHAFFPHLDPLEYKTHPERKNT